MKGFSILSLMVGAAVLGSAPASVLAQSRSFPIDQQISQGRVQTVAQQSKSGLITWREFIARGGRRFVNRDYDLPPEFRNGYIYINAGADNHTGYILKQGLSTYPPVKAGVTEIDYALGDSYVKSGKAIMFNWGGSAGSYQAYGKDTELRFVKNTGQFCLRLTCLEAPFMTKQQISRILHSEREIKQKN